MVTFLPHRWSTQGAGSWALVLVASVRRQLGSCSGGRDAGWAGADQGAAFFFLPPWWLSAWGQAPPGSECVWERVRGHLCVCPRSLCSVSTSVHVWAIPTRLLEPLAL